VEAELRVHARQVVLDGLLRQEQRGARKRSVRLTVRVKAGTTRSVIVTLRRA
jgi:hypothetical protein